MLRIEIDEASTEEQEGILHTHGRYISYMRASAERQ